MHSRTPGKTKEGQMEFGFVYEKPKPKSIPASQEIPHIKGIPEANIRRALAFPGAKYYLTRIGGKREMVARLKAVSTDITLTEKILATGKLPHIQQHETRQELFDLMHEQNLLKTLLGHE